LGVSLLVANGSRVTLMDGVDLRHEALLVRMEVEDPMALPP
jgi:hypothetical protein